jgi:hypothetical protein
MSWGLRPRAGDRVDEMVRTHVQGAAIVLPILADEDRIDRPFMGRLPDHCNRGVCNAHYWGRHLLADQSSFCEAIRQGILALRVRVSKLTAIRCSRIAITCSGHCSMNVTSNPVRAKSARMEAPAPQFQRTRSLARISSSKPFQIALMQSSSIGRVLFVHATA